MKTSKTGSKLCIKKNPSFAKRAHVHVEQTFLETPNWLFSRDAELALPQEVRSGTYEEDFPPPCLNSAFAYFSLSLSSKGEGKRSLAP